MKKLEVMMASKLERSNQAHKRLFNRFLTRNSAKAEYHHRVLEFQRDYKRVLNKHEKAYVYQTHVGTPKVKPIPPKNPPFKY